MVNQTFPGQTKRDTRNKLKANITPQIKDVFTVNFSHDEGPSLEALLEPEKITQHEKGDRHLKPIGSSVDQAVTPLSTSTGTCCPPLENALKNPGLLLPPLSAVAEGVRTGGVVASTSTGEEGELPPSPNSLDSLWSSSVRSFEGGIVVIRRRDVYARKGRK